MTPDESVKYLAGLKRAVRKVEINNQEFQPNRFPVCPPKLLPGIVPAGKIAPVMAMDANPGYGMASEAYPGWGFPGFAYLSMLATRTEFRAFAAAVSTELTREWIQFSSIADNSDSNGRIKEIEAAFKDLKVRDAIANAASDDCFFGRAQLFIDIDGQDRELPLVLDPRTIKRGSLKRVTSVEAIWTTPSAYNALDPAASDFYRPSKWFMLGQEVHASRLLTIVTRKLPDILKPAFNFGGMSLSQLAEPYVDNWIRTRQSVSDLLYNFSILVMKTNMTQVLSGDDDGHALFDRIRFFTATRSNQGVMILDKDMEDMNQLSVPISGLHELQAQSQEQMCAPAHMPAVILTGISPSGFGNTSEGEMEMWRDWVAAQQEANWRTPIEIILKIVQLHLFGEIDPSIRFAFLPLKQMTPGELATIRLQNSQSDTAYVNAGVLDPSEPRERLARDPDSGYNGLDVEKEIVPPNGAPEDEEDPTHAGKSDNGAQDANLLTADPTDTPASMMRKAVQSELDAIELYEKMAALTKNEAVRRRLLDVAREEKTHVGEFESILLELDKEQAAELAKGAEEVAKDS